jgi:hypothetical protein
MQYEITSLVTEHLPVKGTYAYRRITVGTLRDSKRNPSKLLTRL